MHAAQRGVVTFAVVHRHSCALDGVIGYGRRISHIIAAAHAAIESATPNSCRIQLFLPQHFLDFGKLIVHRPFVAIVRIDVAHGLFGK